MGCIRLSQNDYFKCAQIPLKDCRTLCNLECIYISCRENITLSNLTKSSNETYGMCLPKELALSEYEQRCNSFKTIDFVEKINECDNLVPRIIAETKKIPTFLIILALALLFFVFSLIFYRWKVWIILKEILINY